jgi:hypothetical protein
VSVDPEVPVDEPELAVLVEAELCVEVSPVPVRGDRLSVIPSPPTDGEVEVSKPPDPAAL